MWGGTFREWGRKLFWPSTGVGAGGGGTYFLGNGRVRIQFS